MTASLDRVFDQLLRETVQSVEQELALDMKGYTILGGTGDILTAAERQEAVKTSRLYYLKDPLAKQAIRLWTDYTFGSGMTYQAEDERIQEALDNFWGAQTNRPILSAKGQRKSSDKLLVDGEVFFAIFLGPDGIATIRRIDPLEITEIITDPEDIENVRYYRRVWMNQQFESKISIYRSITNVKDEPTKDMLGATVRRTDEALVYHLAYNTIGQRGYPLLLPALEWIKQYRRFLASRVAVMLALARFAWKIKVMGGSASVAATKAVYQEKTPQAGAVSVENQGADLQPIRTDSGASQAYQDGRMLKLQVAAAVGIPEQYFGDISIGNLATAKTVELPMQKMFSSYQKVWADVYQDIDEVVLNHNGVSKDRWYVDRDFPPIAPEDVVAVSQMLMAILQVMPQFADSRDVQQVALMALGINNTAEVLDALTQEAKTDINVRLSRVLREFREVVKAGNGQGHRRKISGV